MEEKHINKKITFSIVAVLLIVLVTIGATYAYFSAQAQTDVQTVTTGTLTMGFTNGEIINATGITPINDSEIKTKATSLPFSITNTGNQHMNITIKLTDITIDDALKDIDFRWGLYNADTDKGISFGIFKYSTTGGEEIIYRDSIIDAGAPTKNYVLRIWIHDDGALQNEMQGKTFSAKVTVTGEAIEYTPESCFGFSNGTITSYRLQYDSNGDVMRNENGGYIYDETCPTDVVIPRTIDGVTVTSLSPYLFEYWGGNTGEPLTSVIIPDTVTSLSLDEEGSNSTFSGNNFTHITIPESLSSNSCIECLFGNNFSSIILPENFSITPMQGFSINNVVVTSGNLGMGDGIYDMTDIVLMEGITSLAGFAINSDKLTSIEIPSSVTSIGYDVFEGCPNLTEIIVRGKSSLSDFTSAYFPDGVNVIYRP